jgi:hypothetical protein
MILAAPDKFNRYYFAAQYVRVLCSSGLPNPAILDLGSNENLLSEYLDGYPVLQGDPDRKNAAGRLVQCRGEQTPFRDKSFDIVVCLDVLEHLTEESRFVVLDEISRVASHTVLLAFPAKNDFNVTHEKTLAEIHSYLYEEPNRFLQEHIMHGLVDSGEVDTALSGSFHYRRKLYIFPNHIWLLSSLIEHFLGILPETRQIREEIFLLINSTPVFCRKEKDSYRTVIIGSKFPLPEFTETHFTFSDSGPRPGDIVNAFKKTHSSIKNLSDYAVKLETAVHTAKDELKQSQIAEASLKKELQELSSGSMNHEIQMLRKEYDSLERYCLHLENVIMQKEHMILELQEKCTALLVEYMNRKM